MEEKKAKPKMNKRSLELSYYLENTEHTTVGDILIAEDINRMLRDIIVDRLNIKHLLVVRVGRDGTRDILTTLPEDEALALLVHSQHDVMHSDDDLEEE